MLASARSGSSSSSPDRHALAPVKVPARRQRSADQDGGISTVHRLKITLKDVKPPVWRRLLVPSEYTLAEFHEVLLIAMGWAGYHLYAIRIGDTSYEEDEDGELDAEDPASARLGDVVGAGDRFVDEYDFGDGWEHEVVVEAVEPASRRTAPVCVDGRRTCPPEDVGSGVTPSSSTPSAIRSTNGTSSC